MSSDGLAFTRVQGKAASYLGVEQGLTMEQFEDLHHGRWNGQQLSQMSYRPVWELDDAGKSSATPGATRSRLATPRARW